MGQRHRLGLPSATVLVVASMIGAGVFTTSGFALADLGSPWLVLLAWTIGGMVALLGALSYGALASRLARSGGEYHFLGETLHPFFGFLAGWISLLVGFTAPIALAAAGFQAYVSPWWPNVLPIDSAGTLAILVAGGLHAVRARTAVLLQDLVCAVKLALIVLLAGFGISRLGAIPTSIDATFDLPAFCVTLVWISLSFSGWNAAIYVAGEIREAPRTVPRAMLLGTGLVTVLYLLLNGVFVFSAPVDELSGQPDVAAVAAAALGGSFLEGLTRLIVALALLSSIFVMIMSGPRVYERMAEDGYMPRSFARGGDAPRVATVFQIVCAIGVLWVSELRELLGYIGFTLGLSTALCVYGLLRLRGRLGSAAVPVPGFPWVPVIFMAATLGSCTFMMLRSWREPVAGLATLLIGATLWLAMERRRGEE